MNRDDQGEKQMCCRFYVEPEDEYFRQMAERIAASPLMSRFRGKLPVNAQGAYGGEVAPTSVVPVLAPNRSGEQTVFPMQWGYTLPASGERKLPLIINARSETAAEKPLFRDSWRSRRCVVPVTAYFEWEHRTGFDGKPKTGDKYRITPAAGERTFLAGLYRMEDGIPSFVILTRAPADNLFWMHDRMPLLLPESAVTEWISPENRPENCLAFALTDTVWEKAQAGGG